MPDPVQCGPGRSAHTYNMDGRCIFCGEWLEPEKSPLAKLAQEASARGQSAFEKELESLINRYSKENGSNTPYFILAEYLSWCLQAFDECVTKRDRWYGLAPKPGASDL